MASKGHLMLLIRMGSTALHYAASKKHEGSVQAAVS